MPTSLAIAACLLMVIGLIGSVLPIVPGPLLIWLGALLWAWQDGFQAVGWPTLAVLGILTLVAWSSDLILTTLTSRRAGAGWKAVAGAIAGGLVGGFIFSGLVPILGSLLGAVLGAVAGILTVEYLAKHSWSLAILAARGYIVGYLAAIALEALLALAMILLFVWQAFL